MMHDYYKIPGWFNYHEAYDKLATELPDESTIVEIGSFMGRSTKYLATNFWNAEKMKVRIHSVDTFKGSSEHSSLKTGNDFSSIFKDNLQFFLNREMVIQHKGRSDDKAILDYFKDESIDALMIDGAHELEAVKEDVINWYPKVKKGGVIFGDDFYLKSVQEGMKQGLNHVKEPEYTTYSSQESVWFISKGINSDTTYQKLVPGINCLV